MRKRAEIGCIFVMSVLLAACSGGGGGGPTLIVDTFDVRVQVSWAANREAAVNRPGGGYKVYYSQSPGFDIATASVKDVPYSSGATAPVSTTIILPIGTHYIKVVAYSVLNADGSSPSAEFSIAVP